MSAGSYQLESNMYFGLFYGDILLHRHTVEWCVFKFLGIVSTSLQAVRNSIRRCDFAKFQRLLLTLAGSYKLNLKVRFGQFFGAVLLGLQAVINQNRTCILANFTEIFRYIGTQLKTLLYGVCVFKFLVVVSTRLQAVRNSIRRCDLAYFQRLFFTCWSAKKKRLSAISQTKRLAAGMQGKRLGAIPQTKRLSTGLQGKRLGAIPQIKRLGS